MIRFFSTILLSLAILTATAQSASELRLLSRWLEGEFTTEGNALIEPRTEHQKMRFVRIWKHLPDPWFYMEQSNQSNQEEPIRQWIYRLDQQGEHIMLEPHVLPEDFTMAGNLSARDLEKELDFDLMDVEDGCEIFVTYDGFAVFSGATVQNYCELQIDGATHIRIRLNISDSQIDWWEYGMQTNETFLWGSAKDAQEFIKQ